MIDIKNIKISLDGTHHVYNGKPLYSKRFISVQSFHYPGLAAVQDETGWYHIDTKGMPVYKQRYKKAYGYYEGLAVVQDETGWYHIDTKGMPAYKQRYAWVGNFQEGRCSVCDFSGNYFHIKHDGTPAYKEKYRYVGDYRYGLAVVYTRNGQAMYIDRDGIPRNNVTYPWLHVYHKGYALAHDGRGFFHIDRKGNPLYSRRFAYAEPFYNGRALVMSFSGELEIIDETGKTVMVVSENKDKALREVMNDLVAFWKTQIIHAAVKLGIFEHLLDKPKTVKYLSSKTGVPMNTIVRLLDALVVHGYLKKYNEKYWITSKGIILQTKLYNAALFWGDIPYMLMHDLHVAIRTGKKCLAEDLFSFMYKDGKNREILCKMTTEYARIDYPLVVKYLDMSKHKAVMDVGGGEGILLELIKERWPNIRCILFEREEIKVNSTKIDEIKKGNFFEKIPRCADAIILARVLHDWDDSTAQRILKNVYDALPPNGTVYIIELVKPEFPEADMGYSLDLYMLCLHGSKERTLNEFKHLLKEAGLVYRRCIKTNTCLSVIVAQRRQI